MHSLCGKCITKLAKERLFLLVLVQTKLGHLCGLSYGIHVGFQKAKSYLRTCFRPGAATPKVYYLGILTMFWRTLCTFYTKVWRSQHIR